MNFKVAIGQDSHRFADVAAAGTADRAADGAADAAAAAAGAAAVRRLMLGGVEFRGEPALSGNSDADVVLHALCNAVSGVTGVNILGEISDRMCFADGITDSAAYVREALKYLEDGRVAHVSFSIECARPAISPRMADMRDSVSRLLGIDKSRVCITATSGEGLTDFGRGLGVQALCVITVEYD